MTILLTLGLSGGSNVPFAASGSKNSPRSATEREKDLTGNLELGELGQLTITNDNESSYDVSEKFVKSMLPFQ